MSGPRVWLSGSVICLLFWAPALQVIGAERVITLAPHLTDMVVDIGASDQLVGVSRFSSLPSGHQQIPEVGDAFQLNVEQIMSLQPDLILAWEGGAPRTVARLTELGFQIIFFNSDQLSDIAENYAKLGRVLGKTVRGRDLGNTFRNALQVLGEQYRTKSQKRVFMQIAEEQLFTTNNKHFMGQALSVCGAENIFAEAIVQIPVVSLEQVLLEAPDVIVLVGTPNAPSDWSSRWSRYLPTTRIVPIDADLLSRPSRRILSGVEALCREVHYEG